MGLSRTTPTSETSLLATTVESVKQHLRVTHNDDDAYINLLIMAATAQVEVATNRQLINATYAYKIDDFPREIELPKPPLSSVTSIAYIDTDGVSQTVSSSDYVVYTTGVVGRIGLAYGSIWPIARNIPEAVTVTYVAGYGATPASVPASIKQAINLLVGHWYTNREAIDIDSMANLKVVPLAFKSLCTAFWVPVII